MVFTRHEVLSGDIEKRIITGLIVDNKFCREAVPILRPKYFQIDYTRKVAQWVADYWKKYKKAPGKDIQAIFQSEEKILKPAEAGIIEEFLKEISSQYENDVNFNTEYLLDQTYKYSESRSYEILKDQIEGSLLQGKLDKAAEAIRGFNKVAMETSRWVNPFDKAEVDKTLDDDASDNLFRLPGALGELIGTLKREWLIAVMGPMKRGKCVSGDTKVLLENGSLITIRDLVKSGKKEKVVSFNENTQKFESVKVSELFDNGIKECLEVTTRTGRKVATTYNHQYLTPYGWKYLQDIRVKDFIAVPKKVNFFGTNNIKEPEYLNSEILWDEIVSIKDVGKMDTYDITVPKHHNFVGDDIILHNSFYAWEIVYHALIARLKVAVFSLEMNSTQFKKRIYKRMTAMAEYEGEYEYPVFDCAYNQDGSCLKEERKNRRALVLDDGTLPEYSRNSKYKPCDYCRHHDKKSYQLAWWWRTHKQKEDLSTEAIAKKVKIFKRLYGNNLRLMCHPPFSASFDDIISDLDNLEYTEGFIPDVILVDYFDITAKTSDDERSDANTKWQRGKHLAGVRRALVINCNQSNRDSIDKKNIGQKNTGEDIRKLAHVDALFVLNQLPSEKKSGRIRIDTLVHRHDEAAEKGQVIVLQQLKLGQPFLDSEWDRPKKKED